MDRIRKVELVKAYVQGWVENDVEMILSALTEDCIITESHGPRFSGKQEVHRWIEDWKGRGSTVKKWEISECIVEGDFAAIQWNFECVDRGEEYRITGSSIICFRAGLIAEIREFMRTREPYDGVQ